MTLSTIWHGLNSWLQALGGADDPLGDQLGIYEQRLIALEGEIQRMHAELHLGSERAGLMAGRAAFSDPNNRTAYDSAPAFPLGAEVAIYSNAPPSVD